MRRERPPDEEDSPKLSRVWQFVDESNWDFTADDITWESDSDSSEESTDYTEMSDDFSDNLEDLDDILVPDWLISEPINEEDFSAYLPGLIIPPAAVPVAQLQAPQPLLNFYDHPVDLLQVMPPQPSVAYYNINRPEAQNYLINQRQYLPGVPPQLGPLPPPDVLFNAYQVPYQPIVEEANRPPGYENVGIFRQWSEAAASQPLTHYPHNFYVPPAEVDTDDEIVYPIREPQGDGDEDDPVPARMNRSGRVHNYFDVPWQAAAIVHEARPQPQQPEESVPHLVPPDPFNFRSERPGTPPHPVRPQFRLIPIDFGEPLQAASFSPQPLLTPPVNFYPTTDQGASSTLNTPTTTVDNPCVNPLHIHYGEIPPAEVLLGQPESPPPPSEEEFLSLQQAQIPQIPLESRMSQESLDFEVPFEYDEILTAHEREVELLYPHHDRPRSRGFPPLTPPSDATAAGNSTSYVFGQHEALEPTAANASITANEQSVAEAEVPIGNPMAAVANAIRVLQVDEFHPDEEQIPGQPDPEDD